MALTIATAFAYGQGNTLYHVLKVTPKMGKTSAWETKWKAHMAKYHAKDDGRIVQEDYGQEMWDKRAKLLSEVTESYETYISKVRKELSTAQAK